jgi:hypothetical protein
MMKMILGPAAKLSFESKPHTNKMKTWTSCNFMVGFSSNSKDHHGYHPTCSVQMQELTSATRRDLPLSKMIRLGVSGGDRPLCVG